MKNVAQLTPVDQRVLARAAELMERVGAEVPSTAASGWLNDSQGNNLAMVIRRPSFFRSPQRGSLALTGSLGACHRQDRGRLSTAPVADLAFGLKTAACERSSRSILLRLTRCPATR